MFNAGVFGGACNCLLCDSHSPVIGMSGGCYALLGMILADLIINWKQKKFRTATLVFLSVLAWMDFVTAWMSTESGKSNTAHLGGYIAGTIMGILIGENLKVKR